MGGMITPDTKRFCMVMWAPSCCEQTIYFSLHPPSKSYEKLMPVCLCMSREKHCKAGDGSNKIKNT